MSREKHRQRRSWRSAGGIEAPETRRYVRRLSILVLLAMVVALVTLTAACGEENADPAGAYVYKSGDSSFSTSRLTLNADSTWSISDTGSQPNWSGGGTWKKTWTGMAINFYPSDGGGKIKADYDGTEIEFGDVVWTWSR